MKKNLTLTENGAVSFASAGKAIIDQFAHAGTAIGRPINQVFAEQAQLWAEDPESAVRFPFYLRLITRKVKVSEEKKTDAVQKGAGLRDEAFKRILWLAYNQPEVFKRNAWLLPVVGSWKDLWTLMLLDMDNENRIDKNFVFSIMAAGLDDETQCDLIRKYMPAIKANGKCKTDRAQTLNTLAKAFASFLGLSVKEYRKMKASGTAHEFQKLICARAYADINWNSIPGRALTNLVSGKFLSNHGLTDSYLKWVMSQPTVKFTGYVYELGMKLDAMGRNLSMNQTPTRAAALYTINKQFDGLIELAKKDQGGIKGNVLCGLDTSGSMSCGIQGVPGLTSYDVCVSLGIYFSELNTGAFHNVVAMFDDTSRVMKLSGTFSEKWEAIRNATTAWGSTNFLSLVRLLADQRKKHKNLPESEFPQTLLVVSDMQFNPTSRWNYRAEREATNQEEARNILREVFSEEFVKNFNFIWWYCASRDGAGHDVPATMDQGGNYMFSGFDGSIVTLLLGGDEQVKPDGTPLTMEEMVQKALSQEIFSFVR
jgi:hypothetical protein